MPFLFSFLTVFDIQPLKFSCSCPSLARKARRRGFSLLYIIIILGHYPLPRSKREMEGVFLPQRAAPMTPELAPPTQPIHQTRKTRLLACFMCSLPPSPCLTCKTHPFGCVLRVRRLPHPAHPLEHP